MTFNQLWNNLMLKKPVPEKGKVVLTKEQFKKQLQQAFEAGAASISLYEKIFGKDANRCN